MDLPIDEHGNLECTICSEAIGTPNDAGTAESPVELPCGHTFGDLCIHQWRLTNNICPNCRAPCPEEARYVQRHNLRHTAQELRNYRQGGVGLGSRALMEGVDDPGTAGLRLLRAVAMFGGGADSSRAGVQAPPQETVAGHGSNRGHRTGSDSTTTPTTGTRLDLGMLQPLANGSDRFRSETLNRLRPEAPRVGFQASTSASRNRRLANTALLAAYASNPSLRRAQDPTAVLAGRPSDSSLRQELSPLPRHSFAEIDARRRFFEGRVIDVALPSQSRGSMAHRATSMGALSGETKHTATQGAGNLNPGQGSRQVGRNLLRTVPEEEEIMNHPDGPWSPATTRSNVPRTRRTNTRGPSDEIQRAGAVGSSDPNLQARWMHLHTISELHELMLQERELGGSSLRTLQARYAMADIIQRRRQDRESFISELSANGVDFALEVGPILRTLDAEAINQVSRLHRLRRDTQEAIAEAERPSRSNTPSPPTSGERLGERR
ncbi:hypothetical protein FKW77_005399 [Venturia effusa]|uniref:RING-type domain-containing protein n=1 Tax=Venturia effusa TaxID=50376 RepID=A0A517LQ57_9PEZI|nr:hypothetical protein FKW77_005399 [Venturia effusa]